MNLWIRSQDREKIVNCNDIVVNGYSIIGYFDKDTEYEDLGNYKSKERALEVLDEIQNKIAYNECLKTMTPKVTAIKGYEEEYGKLFANTIYEIPKE